MMLRGWKSRRTSLDVIAVVRSLVEACKATENVQILIDSFACAENEAASVMSPDDAQISLKAILQALDLFNRCARRKDKTSYFLANYRKHRIPISFGQNHPAIYKHRKVVV
jgi:hypothetical protein